MNLNDVRPGDVIQYANVAPFEQDVPLLVIACDRQESGGLQGSLYVLGIYMVKSGRIVLQNVEIKPIDAHDYEWVIRDADVL